MTTPTELLIRLQCCNLPRPVSGDTLDLRLGIQKGTTVVDDVAGARSEVTFTIPLHLTRNAKTEHLHFGGPFAHGPAAARFLYLCWGIRRDGTWETVRRAKVHISHLTWAAVAHAVEQGHPIEATLDMTDTNGGPVSGSVKAPHIVWDL